MQTTENAPLIEEKNTVNAVTASLLWWCLWIVLLMLWGGFSVGVSDCRSLVH